jgi:spore coat polysaccharide biosynthesis protein SpsF
MRTAIIVQARMGSSRLPGKVLRPLLGKPMLARQLERIRRSALADALVVATTESAADAAVAALCVAEGVACVRGSEVDVLGRYLAAARAHQADVIVRITGDCPLLDSAMVDRCIARFAEGGADYVSNVLRRTLPRGMDTEVFSRAALERIASLATCPEDREHVTRYFYTHPSLFKLGSVESEVDSSQYRLTVDTEDDFGVIEAIYRELYDRNPCFDLADILDLLARRPDIGARNQHVQQKPIPRTANES